MEKVRYMISDAANMVNVETHVLRYWEEELDLDIPRNEMGHRYYTRENIEEFQKIKELKEQGYQLKAIRMLLHQGEGGENPAVLQQMLESVSEIKKNPPTDRELVSALNAYAERTSMSETVRRESGMSAEDRMDQFRELMNDIVGHAIALNNEELSQQIGMEVQERILKELNYLVREQEEAQEERYRKLDAAIRGSIHKKSALFLRTDKKSKKHPLDKPAHA